MKLNFPDVTILIAPISVSFIVTFLRSIPGQPLVSRNGVNICTKNLSPYCPPPLPTSIMGWLSLSSVRWGNSEQDLRISRQFCYSWFFSGGHYERVRKRESNFYGTSWRSLDCFYTGAKLPCNNSNDIIIEWVNLELGWMMANNSIRIIVLFAGVTWWAR